MNAMVSATAWIYGLRAGAGSGVPSASAYMELLLQLTALWLLLPSLRVWAAEAYTTGLKDCMLQWNLMPAAHDTLPHPTSSGVAVCQLPSGPALHDPPGSEGLRLRADWMQARLSRPLYVCYVVHVAATPRECLHIVCLRLLDGWVSAPVPALG